MRNTVLTTMLRDWSLELDMALKQSQAFCLALYTDKKELLYANEAFRQLISGDGVDSFVNPCFDDILKVESQESCVFDGIITLRSADAIDVSIEAKVFRKGNKVLLAGGSNTKELINQNSTLHNLNQEVLNLERKLISKNNNLTHLLSEINTKNDELSQLISDKDLFLQVMAHDLRGPIGSMLKLSEMLCANLSNFSSDRVELMLDTIYKTLDSTFHLLNDLLLWAKSQAGKLPFEPSLFSANQICEEVINLYLQNPKSISVKCNIEDEINLKADANMLKTVLRNLMSNALKFTPEGGEILMSIIKEEDHINFSVADSGVGMSEEVVEKMFDFSERKTTLGTNGEKGTGLGLQLCYDFVKLHGGHMQVKSELGHGSEFVFSIPLE